ncbi:MAG: hypothetical protein B7C24_01375 [Bacteroidetes bacterium 4572_77]|nr:MAG: hypothetical protein B7C24_01375 [Bacteroidetes bacterium 4572_77]
MIIFENIFYGKNTNKYNHLFTIKHTNNIMIMSIYTRKYINLRFKALCLFAVLFLFSPSTYSQNTDLHSLPKITNNQKILNHADSLSHINIPLSLNFCLQEIEKIDIQDNPILFFKLLNLTKYCYYNTAQLVQADSISKYIQALIVEDFHPVYHSEILLTKAKLALSNNRNIESVRLARSALIISERNENPANQIEALTILSRLYSKMDRIPLSLEYIEEAVALSKKTRTFTDDYKTIITRSSILLQSNAVKEAQKDLIVAYQISKQLNNIGFQTNATFRTGQFFYNQKNYIKALEQFERSLVLAKSKNRQTFIANILTYKAAVAGKLGDYRLAVNYNRQALQIRKKAHQQQMQGSSYYNIASSIFYLNQYDSVLFYIKKGEEKYRPYHQQPDFIRGFDLRRKVAIAQGNYKKAFFLLEESMQILDSLFLNENKAKIDDLESDFSRGKYEQLKTEMETEVSLQKALGERNSLLLNFLLFILVLVAISSYFAYIRYRNINRRKIALASQKLILVQMNSHFVFNALTAIQSLIYKQEIDATIYYLSVFSNMMNKILDVSNKSFVSLKSEIDFVKYFLQIQHLRFGDDLNFNIEIDDEIDLSKINTPPMLIYPFIEYAVEECVQKPLIQGKEKPSILIVLKQYSNYTSYKVIDINLGFSSLNNCFIKRHGGQEISCQTLTKERMSIYNNIFKTKLIFVRSTETILNVEYPFIEFQIKK